LSGDVGGVQPTARFDGTHEVWCASVEVHNLSLLLRDAFLTMREEHDRPVRRKR
jgi:hypothetical protein